MLCRPRVWLATGLVLTPPNTDMLSPTYSRDVSFAGAANTNARQPNLNAFACPAAVPGREGQPFMEALWLTCFLLSAENRGACWARWPRLTEAFFINIEGAILTYPNHRGAKLTHQTAVGPRGYRPTSRNRPSPGVSCCGPPFAINQARSRESNIAKVRQGEREREQRQQTPTACWRRSWVERNGPDHSTGRPLA